MRLFIAFEIPNACLDDLERIAERTRSLFPGSRPVPRENLHVTVHFAGECDFRRADALRLAMVEAYHESQAARPPVFPATLSVARPGCFTMGRSGVLWLSVEPAEPVLRFHSRLMESLARFGLLDGRQRPPVPHITIARNLPPNGCRLSGHAILPPDSMPPLHFHVPGPALMESCQGRGRMLYHARCRPASDEGWIVSPDP